MFGFYRLKRNEYFTVVLDFYGLHALSVVIKRVIHRICKFTIGKRLDETLHGVFNGMFGAEAEFARLVDRK